MSTVNHSNDNAATMFDPAGKTKFLGNRGLVTANTLETCTISPTRISYASRIHSAPELKVEETRRSRSSGKSLEEFSRRVWKEVGCAKSERGRRGASVGGQGRSNRLVRALPRTLTNS